MDRSSAVSMIDVQAQQPSVQLSLSRVGVTDVEKVIRLRHNGIEQLFSARFECVVELGPNQKGAHMSRFEEVVNEAIGQVVLNETSFKVETLAEHIAQLVRERQGARRAEVKRRLTKVEQEAAMAEDAIARARDRINENRACGCALSRGGGRRRRRARCRQGRTLPSARAGRATRRR